MSSSEFVIPPYQREYSWEDEVSEFWNDLSKGLGDEPYFLGLVILTEEEGRKQVVDGQQRILTLTLLAAALFHEAIRSKRKALAERIQSDFLRSIDYNTDETNPRVTLSDSLDNQTLQAILENGGDSFVGGIEQNSISKRLLEAFEFLRSRLRKDLAQDPFKRLGAWTDFLTNRVYFAVFVHPDSASAYRVYEVINTRGRELTTADLLKNYILSQTKPAARDALYARWQAIARQFPIAGANSFVQYIRHVVTLNGGHILPKDLFDFLAQRATYGHRKPPTPSELMDQLETNLPLYLQMVDPSLDGPADPVALRIFSALNSLSVISIRPILLAVSHAPNQLEGMTSILRLVVRRIVVGNLGTGNVERRFGEAAWKVNASKNWKVLVDDLRDLNPEKDDFIRQLTKRSFNKEVLAFLRRSTIARSVTPDEAGELHFILPRNAETWDGISEEDANFWGSTIGNTFLSTLKRRPKGANSWEGFKSSMLRTGIDNEWVETLVELDPWDARTIESVGSELAQVAGDVWF